MKHELKAYLDTVPILDTHEHLLPYESQRRPTDFFEEYLSYYFSADLVSAGMSRADLEFVRRGKASVEEKWSRAEPYWEAARYTGYGQALDLAARDLYGIERIDRDTVYLLNDRYMACVDGGHYQRVLKERCGIRLSILDMGNLMDADERFFLPANRIDGMIFPQTAADLMELERNTGTTVSTFRDYLNACESQMHLFAAQSRLLKCAVAYSRSLAFDHVDVGEAEKGFHRLLNSSHCIEPSQRNYQIDKAFSDYMMRYILSIAQKLGMVLQIHTGLQEGNGNILANSSPGHLNQLFHEFPGLNFDVFHIGYPYEHELGTLCKMYPNVYVDLCWSYIISPVAAAAALEEWLEMVPANKLLGFGGDYQFPDGVYAQQLMARRCIAEVLAGKTEKGLFDEGTAQRIGGMLLHDNARKLYGL